MRHLFLILSYLSLTVSFAQEEFSKTIIDSTFFTKADSLYREDQFYIGLTYNLLMKAPQELRQTGFSSGISAGFLRDMPINKRRTYAIAVGAGLSYSSYKQNLIISESAGEIDYNIVKGSDLTKGKFEQFFVDVPVEFRWRNSTPTSYKFWRIYTGVKFQYLLYDKSRYIGKEVNEKVTSNKDFNKFQYGPYIAVGFNTWNFQAYYGVNSVFKNASMNGEAINMRTFNLGMMFYIL